MGIKTIREIRQEIFRGLEEGIEGDR